MLEINELPDQSAKKHVQLRVEVSLALDFIN